MAELDILSLGIKSDVDKAVSSLNKLTKSLQGLQSISPTTIDSVSKSILHLSNSIKPLADIKKLPSFNSLAKSIPKIGTSIEEFDKLVDCDKLERVSVSLASLAPPLQELSAIKKLPSLTSLANGLERLSKIDMESVMQGSYAVAESIKIINNSATDESRQLIDSLGAIYRNAGKLATSLKKLTEVDSDKVLEVSYAVAEAIKIIKEQATEDVVNLVSSLATIYRNAGKNIGKALKQGVKEGSANATDGAVGEVQVPTLPITNVAGTSGSISALQRLKDALSSIRDEAKRAGSTIKSVLVKAFNVAGAGAKALVGKFVQITRNMRNASNQTSVFGGRLRRAVTGILYYNMVANGIRAVTSGIGDGIKNLYYANAQFATSMDSAASSMLYLRNSMAAMLSPAIEALEPILYTLIDGFVDLINVVNMAISALTGKDTWTKAVRVPTKYADALDTATDSTKKAAEAQAELKKTLLGFDEIQKLDKQNDNDNDNKSPSSKNNKNQVDYSSMFTTEQLAWAGMDAYSIGSALAEKFGDAVDKLNDKINSAEFQKKVHDTCQKVIDFINGFFDTATFGDVKSIASRFGDTIGDALNLALNTIDQFLTGVHWENIGKFVGQALQGAISSQLENKVSFGTIIADWINAKILMLKGFTESVKWSDVGLWVAKNINDAIYAADWSGSGETIGNAIKGVLDTVDVFLQNVDAEALGQGIADFFSSLDIPDILFKIANVVLDLAKATVSFADGIGFWDLFRGINLWEGQDELLATLDENFANIISSAWKKAVEAVDFLGELSKKVLNAFSPESIDAKIDVAVKLTQDGWTKVHDWVKDKVGGAVEAGIKLVADGWTKVHDWVADKAGAVLKFGIKLFSEGWDKVSSWVKDHFGGDVKKGVGLKTDGWTSVGSWVGKKMGSAVKATVKLAKGWTGSVASKLGLNNLSTAFKIKLPKVSVYWTSSLFGIKVPHFNVKWNAKGGILNGAQLFGMMGNTMLGGGEAGKEAVLPLERNTSWMDTIAAKTANKVNSGNSGNNQPVTINVTMSLDGQVIGRQSVKYIKQQASMGRFPLAGTV